MGSKTGGCGREGVGGVRRPQLLGKPRLQSHASHLLCSMSSRSGGDPRKGALLNSGQVLSDSDKRAKYDRFGPALSRFLGRSLEGKGPHL